MQADHWPAVAVVGAGAVGCYFGGMLARSGVPVTLIGRQPHMQAIARDGLHLNGLRVQERISMAVSTSIPEGVRDARVVLFAVKTVDTETAAREMHPFLSPEAAVLSFQNGVDNVDRIYSATGLRAIPAAVYVAAEMTAPGEVTQTGRGDLVVGHRAGWPREPGLKPLAAMFEHAEIPCRIADTIETELWTKMVMNCAYNAISALTRTRYGRLARFEPVRGPIERAIAETVAVARAEGVSLDEPTVVEAAFRLGAAMTRALSSTAQDIARGRPTEIDSLNGYVARRAAALGIATPVSDTLYALVKLLEGSGDSPPDVRTSDARRV
jgi:2-dehydropantoate 2-reductase